MKEKLWRLLRNPAMGDIRHWAKPCRRTVWTLCVLEVLFSACSLLVTLETKGLVDGATGQDMRRLQVCAVLLLLTVLMKRGLALLTNLLSVKANAALQKSLQANILRTLMKKQYASLTAFHSGELVSRMLSDVQVVKNGILEILPGMARMAVSFFGAAILLLTMDWRLVVILIAGGLLGVILVAVLETPMKKRHTAVQEAQEKYHASLQETLENLLLVKAGGSEERMQRQIGQKQEQLAQAQRKRGNFSAWMNQGITLAFQLSWVLCLLWGGLGIYRGSMTYGMLAAMLQLVNLVQGPISTITGIAGQAYAALISAERIRELTELPQEPEGTPIASGDFAELRMENVSFAYEKNTDPVLHRASCTLMPGISLPLQAFPGKERPPCSACCWASTSPTAAVWSCASGKPDMSGPYLLAWKHGSSLPMFPRETRCFPARCGRISPCSPRTRTIPKSGKRSGLPVWTSWWIASRRDWTRCLGSVAWACRRDRPSG